MMSIKVAATFLLSSLLLFAITDGRSLRGKRQPRIVGGRDATAGEFPFMASLQLNTSVGFMPYCGAAIVDKYHVLTTGYCVYEEDEENWSVVAGALNINNTAESGRVHLPVAKFYLHGQFDDATLNVDIALVRVDGEFPLGSETINSIPLRSTALPASSTCTVMGWGYNGTVLPGVLQALDVTLVDQTVCTQTYEDYFFTVLPGMECFGTSGGGHDICNFDYGDPLVCDGQLSALASWAILCAIEGYPAVYTDIAHYYDWYQETLAQSYKDAGLSMDG